MPTNQIKRLLRALTVQQRWSIGIASVLLVAGMYGFLRWQREANFRPLFTDLAAEDAGPVVQKLKEEGVSYRLSTNGGTISVPEDRVAELRLEMAGAGLPKSGRLGFELFDKANFGITEFAEHVNYRRALEGELERSVMSVAQIEQARVHISMPEESVFLEARQPAKASVLVKIRRGSILPESALPAITNLVASAVEGLAPESVSVLDMRGNLLSRPKRADSADASSSGALEYRQKVEHDLAAKLDSTLEPLLGTGRFRTAVSAECEMKSGEQSEETFDPEHSVMVSSQKTEDIASQLRPVGGVPGTASTLPDDAPRPLTPTPTTSRKTESVNYQTSHTVKRLTLPQGAIQRLSVSVLLDYDVQFQAGKRILTAPDENRLKVIHDLVAAAAGLNPERGDQLIVESLPFESTLNLEAPVTEAPAPGPASKNPLEQFKLDQFKLEQLKKNPKLMIGLAALVVLLLSGGFFAIYKIKRSRKTVREVVAAPQLPPPAEIAVRPADAGPPQAAPPAHAIAALGPAPVEALAAQVRAAAQTNAEICAGVLRGWLKEEGA
jgi:flagellar M-ring protein FliF